MKKTAQKELLICQLYPQEMNIYGDFGNALTLAWRAKNYGFSPKIVHHEIGDDPEKTILRADILLGGGGQDSGQNKILADLQKNGEILRKCAKNGVPMLMICGLYQLFGEFFRTVSGEKMRGIGVFDMTTIGGEERLIGNIATMSEFGVLAGYENHSGKTILGKNSQPLGVVLSGAGNNGADLVEISANLAENSWLKKRLGIAKKAQKNPDCPIEKGCAKISGASEGARIYNVFGSYLHGPILPKNIALADEILRITSTNKFGAKNLVPSGDAAAENLRRANQLAKEAQLIAISRER